jgi:glycosyltransferase involved in cell wall biosynthesis
MFTVFTPTYNRANLLPGLFQSLCHQSCRDFEWIIVDDSSEDETPAVVKIFESMANFPITYVVQKHGGKHKAVNLGVQLARGRFFGIADSDDYYTPDALELCWQHYGEIPNNKKHRFVGMTGLCATPSGEVVGSRFPSEVFDSDALGLVASRVDGDKAGFLLTEVLRQFPFPEDLGSFVPEGLVWNRIARQFATRYFNETVMVREYQSDGLSARMSQIRMDAPRAARQYYLEFLLSGRRMPLDVNLRYAANYVRFSLHAGERVHDRFSFLRPLYVAAAPIGRTLYLLDKYKSPAQVLAVRRDIGQVSVAQKALRSAKVSRQF